MPAHCFMMGKGGVGKSTTAALMSVFLASKNRRVLLVSLDPAHNLSDIFEMQFSDRPLAVDPFLKVLEVDQERWIKKYLLSVRSEILQTYRYLTAFNLDGYLNVMKFAPGLEEYALLLAFQHITGNSADFDCLVFDMPPTALALRFFGLPALSSVWIEALLKMRREIIRKKEMITRIKLGNREFEKDKVLLRILERQGSYENLRAVFTDPQKTRINLVLNPDRLSLSESQRIVQTLKGLEMPVARIIVNKVQSCAPGMHFDGALADIPVTGIPCMPMPLIGLKPLRCFLETHCEFFEQAFAA
jgi:arsenite/tail-anchored protein-transporting ATPase